MDVKRVIQENREKVNYYIDKMSELDKKEREINLRMLLYQTVQAEKKSKLKDEFKILSSNHDERLNKINKDKININCSLNSRLKSSKPNVDVIEDINSYVFPRKKEDEIFTTYEGIQSRIEQMSHQINKHPIIGKDRQIHNNFLHLKYNETQLKMEDYNTELAQAIQAEQSSKDASHEVAFECNTFAPCSPELVGLENMPQCVFTEEEENGPQALPSAELGSNSFHSMLDKSNSQHSKSRPKNHSENKVISGNPSKKHLGALSQQLNKNNDLVEDNPIFIVECETPLPNISPNHTEGSSGSKLKLDKKKRDIFTKPEQKFNKHSSNKDENKV